MVNIFQGWIFFRGEYFSGGDIFQWWIFSASGHELNGHRHGGHRGECFTGVTTFQRFMFIAQIFPSELCTVECCLVLVVDGFPNYKIMGDNAFLSFSTGALVPSMTWPKLPCLAFYLRLFSTLFPNPHDRSHLKQFNTIAWIFSNSPPRIFWLFFRQSVIAEKWQWGTGGGQRLSIVTLNMCPHTCLSSAVKTPR